MVGHDRKVQRLCRDHVEHAIGSMTQRLITAESQRAAAASLTKLAVAGGAVINHLLLTLSGLVLANCGESAMLGHERRVGPPDRRTGRDRRTGPADRRQRNSQSSSTHMGRRRAAMPIRRAAVSDRRVAARDRRNGVERRASH
jgi:hypothetical protein